MENSNLEREIDVLNKKVELLKMKQKSERKSLSSGKKKYVYKYLSLAKYLIVLQAAKTKLKNTRKLISLNNVPLMNW